MDVGGASVTELSGDLNQSRLPRLGYRSTDGEISLCSGDSKLFLIGKRYPNGCKKYILSSKSDLYVLPVIIVLSLVGSLVVWVVYKDIRHKIKGYKLLDSKDDSVFFQSLNY